jgi:hypothetical protein
VQAATSVLSQTVKGKLAEDLVSKSIQDVGRKLN